MAEDTATVARAAPAADSVDPHEVSIDAPERWEPWETQLVGWSIGIGVAALIVLGTLINIFLLD